MYTEGFTGDIDGILARMAAISCRQFIVNLPESRGRGGYYGLSKAQTAVLADELLTIARAFNAHEIDGAVIFIDQHSRIYIRKVEQAANLYQRITHNCFIAGMCGGKGKPKIKQF